MQFYEFCVIMNYHDHKRRLNFDLSVGKSGAGGGHFCKSTLLLLFLCPRGQRNSQPPPPKPSKKEEKCEQSERSPKRWINCDLSPCSHKLLWQVLIKLFQIAVVLATRAREFLRIARTARPLLAGSIAQRYSRNVAAGVGSAHKKGVSF